MPQLIATRSFAYAGKRLEVGDRFEARAMDAKVLKAIKKAEDPPAAAHQAKPQPAAKPPQPQQHSQSYTTRRLKADD